VPANPVASDSTKQDADNAERGTRGWSFPDPGTTTPTSWPRVCSSSCTAVIFTYPPETRRYAVAIILSTLAVTYLEVMNAAGALCCGLP
jgi:hypothetical protein